MGAAASMIYSGAVEEVGGMIVSSAFSSVMSRFEMQEGLDMTLYSLQHEVSKTKSAINVAKGRRISDQQLLEWLAKIISAAYRGEYYYCTFKNQSSLPPMIAGTEGMGNLLIGATSRPTKRQRTVRTLLFGNDEHRELHDALKMLKCIDICAFLLMVNAQPERPMKRYLYMDHTWLTDRGKEKEQVMKFLFEPSMAGENNVDILPIVGLSDGVGKTTLALHCSYDSKVQNHFSLKVYCPGHLLYRHNGGCPRIYQQILKRCNNTVKTNFDENTLQAMLKQNLSSEKFLIIMDDIYPSKDSTVWNDVLGCLRCGGQESKIIFTSVESYYNKHKNIRDMGTVKPIMLDGFSEDTYMLFFREHAFGSADPDDHPELAKMGGVIAKKMNGSIWGAKIIGELLRDNLNAPFWSYFLRDGILNSELLRRKSVWSVVKTIACQLLPEHLELDILIRQTESSVLSLCNELKSYRELLVLGHKYCTPVIKNGKNYGVQFLVNKHFNLHESIVFIATCKRIGGESNRVLACSLWRDIDPQ